jgi:hypothetical protein
MRAVLVEQNGKRVLVAGCASDVADVFAVVEYGREEGQWFTRLDVTAGDSVRNEGFSWRILPLARGDVVTMQVGDAEEVDPWEASVRLSDVGCLPLKPWPPYLYAANPEPSKSIDAMVVEVNGQRVRLAGSKSQEWATVSYFHHGNLRGKWTTTLSTMIWQDKARGIGGAWPELSLNPGDKVTFRFVEVDGVDNTEFPLPLAPDADSCVAQCRL